MSFGTTKRDVAHFNPRCNARGIIKAGTPVRYIRNVGWCVLHHKDVAHFMQAFDFRHSYVDVPADAIKQEPA